MVESIFSITVYFFDHGIFFKISVLLFDDMGGGACNIMITF